MIKKKKSLSVCLCVCVCVLKIDHRGYGFVSCSLLRVSVSGSFYQTRIDRLGRNKDASRITHSPSTHFSSFFLSPERERERGIGAVSESMGLCPVRSEAFGTHILQPSVCVHDNVAPEGLLWILGR